MKVLSIRQPWAEMIIIGRKDVENRTWSTKYRGPFLIHAPKSFDSNAYAALKRESYPLPASVEEFARGAIVGAAWLKGCWFHDELGCAASKWHEPGSCGFYLRNAVRLGIPIPCRGRLNFFDLSVCGLSDEQIGRLRQLAQLTEGGASGR